MSAVVSTDFNIKINNDIINAKGSSKMGTSYAFVDTKVKNKKTYWYKMDIHQCKSAMYGPMSVAPR